MSNEKKPSESLTVYYDGACPLCTTEIGFYETRPGAECIAFIDVAKPGTETGADLNQDAALKRFHVRKADGTLLSGAEAFIEIWATLPGWRWAARIARMPGVPSLMELAYRGFLPVRPALSRIAARFGAKPRTPPALDKVENSS